MLRCLLHISLHITDATYDIKYRVRSVEIESNIVRCPHLEFAEKMIAAFVHVRTKGNSVGGVITFIVRNFPRVLPLYH
ncbi:hypothetical protein ARALYDRAFT_898202 [Arabidopsis lyrata subsp. lyrata]|uniref:chorismate synthase n=1 Tax=Arabidopsis lyrata subsp. lyrata TaxID=81972 RepID=D7L8H2_ARALL|nr:hypothetical protein ARALYDRAFT_898202 [Arabidopsis lyrata subsp. lyrata]